VTPAMLQLILSLIPPAENLILTLIHPDGTKTTLAILQQVDATNQANAQEIQNFLNSLPKATPAK
jgi:hypothetical protein